MTRRLILIRHAKSSWDDPGLDDHDRPLNRRGRASATAIGDWLAARGYRPDLVLSSTARRTVETWERLAPALPAPDIRWQRRLYHAEPEALRDVLKTAGTAATVLLLGHNPGIGTAARAFAAAAPPHPKFPFYPTAATTIYDFPVAEWADVDWGTGRVADFTVPRDLGVD